MKATVLGRNGFIGSELYKMFDGVYPYPRKDVDYLFYFGSPSSQILFNHAEEWAWDETVAGFTNALEFCKENDIKLIYPSTVSEGNTYAKCKHTLDKIAAENDFKKVLGLRISAGYGPGEGHKGEYASIIYQFCKKMKKGVRPVIFGDGTQTRDFIYIDDIVSTIMANLDTEGLIDIGTGVSTNFNDVIQMINQELQTNIQPVYIDTPEGYLKETQCKAVPCKYSLREGIKEICQSL